MKLSKTKIKKNILRVWEQCTEEDKHPWYEQANEFAAGLTNPRICLEQACGIIAALSPMKDWNENKRIAALVAHDNVTSGIHTKLMTQKAVRIAEISPNEPNKEQLICEILRGDKITSFFLNILHPHKVEDVTIDRHAYSIALGRRVTQFNLTKKQYIFYVNCYKEAAAQIGVSPSRLQSATWVRWRMPQFSLF